MHLGRSILGVLGKDHAVDYAVKNHGTLHEGQMEVARCEPITLCRMTAASARVSEFHPQHPAHYSDPGFVTLNARTSQGIMTWPKITGSGHTFTCRPRWPPCGLIHASLGTSPLFSNK